MSFWLGFICFLVPFLSGFSIVLIKKSPPPLRKFLFLAAIFGSILAVGNGIFYAIGYHAPNIYEAENFDKLKSKAQIVVFAISLWPYISIIVGIFGGYLYWIYYKFDKNSRVS